MSEGRKLHPWIKESLLQEDLQFYLDICELMNNGAYDEAYSKVKSYDVSSLDIGTKRSTFLLGELSGLLVDIGAEGKIKQAVEDGLNLIDTYQNALRKVIAESSFEYNIGNAKKSLFDVIRATTENFISTPETIELLTAAKNHYWRAYKSLPKNDRDLEKKILVNLGNSLNASGRTIEALAYFDHVLKMDPSFPRANASKASALYGFLELTGHETISSLYQVKVYFERAINSEEPAKDYIRNWESKLCEVTSKLEGYGYDSEQYENDLEETRNEARKHSEFRRFCIDNHLALCEHAIFCNCRGARYDDLAIPPVSRPIGGKFVPQMELYLNRLKSEFTLARYLYFQSITDSDDMVDSINNETKYTELFEGEEIGLRGEMLRNSFRLCFGILDKIAHGVCDLFDLADEGEKIYFERFWRPRGKSEKQKSRWDTINNIRNYPLLALYSQATDLNTHSGEWKIFKKWRNALEHEMLLLITGDTFKSKHYKLVEKDNHINIDREFFNEKALHLLQLTCSAIFNFVFCVRVEGYKESNQYSNLATANTITLSPK